MLTGIAGKDYLWSIFGDVITSIIGDPELDLEIDPAKIENKNLLALYDQSVEGLIKTRAQKIEDIVRTLVTRITDVESIRKMPVGIRAALAYISAVSRVHTPDLTTQLISGFVILRMFTPAIVTPEATGMIPRDFPPSVRAHRNLVLIAKVFQNIANNGGVASGKERFMEVMRAFVEASAPQMQRYFETLAAPLDPADPVAQLLHDSNPETLPDATVDVRELNINDLFELHRIIDRAAPKLLAKFKASAAPLLKSSSSAAAAAAAAAGQQRLSLSSASSSSSSSATLPLTTSSPLPNPGQGATANSMGQTISSPIGSPPPSSQQQQQPQLSSSPQVRLGQSRGRQTHSNSVTGSQGFVTASPRASTGFVRAVPDAQPRFSAGFLSVGSSQQQQQQQQQQPLSSGTPGYGPSSPSSLSFSLSSTSSSSSSQQQVELPPARKGDFLGGSRANQQQQQQRYTFLGKDSSRRNSTSASATPLSFPAAQVPAVTVQPDQQDDTHSNTSVPPIPTFPLSQQSQPQQPQSAKVPLSPHSAAAAATTTTTATASGWVTTSSKSVRWKKQVLDLLDQLGPPPSYSFGSDACKDETQAASTTAAAAAATAAAAAEAAGAAPATPPGGGLGVGGAAMAAVGTSDMGALERAKFLYQGASSVDGTPVFYLIFNRISMDFLTNVSPLISHVYRVMGPVVDKGPYILVIDMSWCSLSNDEKRIVYNSLKLIWSLLNRK